MPKSIMAVVDAMVVVNRTDRNAVFNQVMLVWAKRQLHLANVVANTTRGNPPLPESSWGTLE